MPKIVKITTTSEKVVIELEFKPEEIERNIGFIPNYLAREDVMYKLFKNLLEEYVKQDYKGNVH